MTEPLFVLSPPRSFTSVVAACIGQHPDVVAVPELNLFVTETMAEWWEVHDRGDDPGGHGLLRAVAQLFFGRQTEDTVEAARTWVQQRLSWDSGAVFAELAERVEPKLLCDKSHRMTVLPATLTRVLTAFPEARYVHLLRHPLPACESMAAASPVDPQRVWFTLHMHIIEFLEAVPDRRQLRVRGEDLLSDPVRQLGRIAQWLDVDAGEAAVDDMCHPERWPFAAPGPRNAQFGSAYSFLASPELRPNEARFPGLDEPLPWRDDGARLMPEVRALAESFGYG